MDVRKISWIRAIRTKIISVIIVTTTMVLGISGYFAYRYTESTKTSELEQLAEVTADRMSLHLQIPLWDVDYDQAGKLIEAEMKERRIAGIAVRDEDGQTLFAARERGADGAVTPSAGNLTGNYVFASRDVTRDDQVIGSVNVFLTPAYLEQELRQFFYGTGAVVVLLDLLMLMILGSVLGGVVVRPIRRLADSAERISQGDLNQEIPVHAHDEIGYLASTLNRMQLSLRVAMTRLAKPR